MTFTVHADALFDPGAPVLGSTHLEARDNLVAAFAGEADAPGLSILALEPLVAGDTIRWEDEFAVVASSNTKDFDISQSGTVRCTITTAVGSGTIQTVSVSRTRLTSVTTLATGSSTPFTVDASVEPGDRITFLASTSSGARTFRVRLNTDGENLWPGVFGLIVS